MTAYALVTGDFVRTGGMDMANYALADYLARQNAELHLVAHRVAEELSGRPNVTTHLIPRPARSHLLGSPLLDGAGRIWGRHVSSRGGRVLVNGGNCQWGDVNWVHYVHAAYRPESRANALHRVKTRLTRIRHLHNERAALSRARVVIANSERTRSDLIEGVGVPAERIHTVYYGIDAERFRPATPEEKAVARKELEWDSERPIVLFIGALGDRRKGFDTLGQAWQRLSARGGWDVDLVVVGSGPELPAWKRWAAEHQLQDRVRFLGFRSDVPRLMAAADALVAPTRYEAYGLGVHEALCAGLPAIVSASAGVAERYPDALRGLLLQDHDDADELAEKLRAWRDRADETRRGVASLSEALRAQTWDTMAARIEAVIQDTR